MTVQEPHSNKIGRLDAYKRGSELIFLWQCIDHSKTVHVETLIKTAFNTHFTRHMDGLEYFEGSRFKMVEVMTTIINDFERSCNNLP
jgi:hypothetical protein